MPTGITEEELATLEAAATELEWNAACTKIRADRNGAIPLDWNARVRLGGVMHRFVQRLNATASKPIVPCKWSTPHGFA